MLFETLLGIEEGKIWEPSIYYTYSGLRGPKMLTKEENHRWKNFFARQYVTPYLKFKLEGIGHG